MGVNLMAPIWGIEIFGPLIEQHGEGGHIVSTASIAGLISGEQRDIDRLSDDALAHVQSLVAKPGKVSTAPLRESGVGRGVVYPDLRPK
jgi:NAD(P)-dependent dehydrogenase (short-subunit alcohol dehydrogenase family)